MTTQICIDPEIAQDIVPGDPEQPVDLTLMVQKWQLDTEQEQVFQLIATHSLMNNAPSLRMFMAGAAGTGKSCVINALKDYFEQHNQAQRFWVCSYMGIAAHNVSGMTLHLALAINQANSSKGHSNADQDLIACWEGVDYLFVHEVSMISCRFLCLMSERLSVAKGNTGAFGGINVIFAGDFAQLPPVQETHVFAQVNARSIAGTPLGQKIIFGHLLWLSMQVVVVLHQ